MYSDGDTPKGWVAPFGHPGIKACSRLPRDFRSVPRPSSPPGAKASTRCPSHAPQHILSLNSRPSRLAREWATLTPSQNPPCTGTIHAPKLHYPRNLSPPGNTQDATHSQSHGKPYSSLSTHIQTPLNTAATPAIRHAAIPAKRQPHALGQTPMPVQPRTSRASPEPTRTTRMQEGQSHPRCPARPETHQNLIHNP